jgi:hypothetical protein
MPWDEARRAAQEYAAARGARLLKSVADVNEGAMDPAILALEMLDLDDDDALEDQHKRELKRIARATLRDYVQKTQESA